VIRWFDHAFWYTLIAMFVIAIVAALGGMVLSIICSMTTIVMNGPAAMRHWLRHRD
jgi:flagellar biosynthesis protein FliQ